MPRRGPTIAETVSRLIQEQGPLTLDELVRRGRGSRPNAGERPAGARSRPPSAINPDCPRGRRTAAGASLATPARGGGVHGRARRGGSAGRSAVLARGGPAPRGADAPARRSRPLAGGEHGRTAVPRALPGPAVAAVERGTRTGSRQTVGAASGRPPSSGSWTSSGCRRRRARPTCATCSGSSARCGCSRDRPGGSRRSRAARGARDPGRGRRARGAGAMDRRAMTGPHVDAAAAARLAQARAGG